jgi:hypothetical protein
MSPQTAPSTFATSSRTPNPNASFTQPNVPTSTAGSNYFDHSRPTGNAQQYQQYLGTHNLFQNLQQQQHQSQQQPQAQQSSPQPFAATMMGRPPFPGQASQLGMQGDHEQQSSNNAGFVGGDTGNFFDQMNMDPATMSALFYGTPVVGSGPEGYGDFSFGSGGQDLSGFGGLDPNLQQQQMAGSSAASRKRVHPPEWDENA